MAALVGGARDGERHAGLGLHPLVVGDPCVAIGQRLLNLCGLGHRVAQHRVFRQRRQLGGVHHVYAVLLQAVHAGAVWQVVVQQRAQRLLDLEFALLGLRHLRRLHLRHDQVVARTGGRHVQQAHVLGVVVHVFAV